MAEINNLIKEIPWDRLSEYSIIAVVFIIAMVLAINTISKYKEKKLEKEMTEIKEDNSTRQKKIDKIGKKIEIDIHKNSEFNKAIVGNITSTSEEGANVKVIIKSGTKINDSRIGNIDGR